MTSWYVVKERIQSALQTVKSSPVLDSAAKTALKSVPYLGDFLVNLYDSTGGSEAERTEKILEILGRLEGFHSQQFKQLTSMLADDREILIRDSQALDKVLGAANETLERLRRIDSGQADLRESSKQVNEVLSEMKGDLRQLSEGTHEFDFEIAAEQLVFFVNVSRLLEQSYEIFFYQNGLARQLTNSLASRGYAIGAGRGFDDGLRELHFAMTAEEEEIFTSIRTITDDMRGVNVKVKTLLKSNKDFFELLPDLRRLYEHLSWWNAKYELLKDDPDMCLVYVGVDQQKPFPQGIERLLAQEIERLQDETRLDMLTEQTDANSVQGRG